jgi:shikimate dehydrogenase
MRFAEVIGDPIGHSLSPAIHGYWLAALGREERYVATRVARGDLAGHIDRRRRDPSWLGCNLTAPHKEAVLPLLDDLEPAAAKTGAVNSIYRQGERLIGANTDVDGLARALAGVQLEGGRAVLIGGGGAARAALAYLAERKAAETVLLLRDPARAAALLGERVGAAPLSAAAEALEGALLIVNASPLGQAGGEPMPRVILDALPLARQAVVMDMVYRPLETPLLAAARGAGLQVVDGLEMLIGQARRAFALLFGVEPPAGDDSPLRARLVDRAGLRL